MQLTALLRAVLRRGSGEFVTLAEELQIVDAYLAIEQARFEDRLRTERHVPTDLESVRVPPLILQPLVENAVKHGIAPKRRGGVVRIEASLTDGTLHLRVNDTGAGVTREELARRRANGLGLASVERRLTQYFGACGGLTIESVPGTGTTVHVFLPIALATADIPALAGARGHP
jgi:two-component system sensor histidine kinase LytS